MFLKHVLVLNITKSEIALLEINRFRAQMNDDAVRFGATLKWTALVTAHVNKTICDLYKWLLWMTLKIGILKLDQHSLHQ